MTELTPAKIVELFDLYEGTGDDTIEILLTNQYGDQLDEMVQVWCLEKYGLELDVKPAYGALYEWVGKENIPLKGKYRELCQQQVQKGINGMNGNAWLEDHATAVVRCALAGSFDERCREMLSKYGGCIHEMDMDELPKVTDFQYQEAAKGVVIHNARQLVEKEGYKEVFDRALGCDEGRLGNCKLLLKEFVDRNPAHQVELVDVLIDCEYVDLTEWLCEEVWYEWLLDAYTVKAKEIYKAACIGWDCEGEDVLNELSTPVRQALAKGGIGSIELPDANELNADLADLKAVSPSPLVGAELLARITELEEAGVASSEILTCCGYYKEGDDYGNANINFFSAKIAAQKSLLQPATESEGSDDDDDVYGDEPTVKANTSNAKLVEVIRQVEINGQLYPANEDVIEYQGEVYTKDATHEVFVLIKKDYWNEEFKDKPDTRVKMSELDEDPNWEIDFAICGDWGDDMENLCEEVFGEDGPFYWEDMDEEQHEEITRAAFDRGLYTSMRHLGITSNFCSDYEDLDEIAYAQALGLDPKKTTVSFQG